VINTGADKDAYTKKETDIDTRDRNKKNRHIHKDIIHIYTNSDRYRDRCSDKHREIHKEKHKHKDIHGDRQTETETDT